MSILLPATGEGYDLEYNGTRLSPYRILPDPQILVPFHQQGHQIQTTPYVNPGQVEEIVLVNPLIFNPLPFTRWTGTTTNQINQPQYMSVNERMR